MAKKYTKAGKVMLRKDGKGMTIVLGNPISEFNKNAKFAFNTEIRITDAEGKEVLGYGKNVFLSLQDPRSRPGITPEQAARIPANIKFDLVLVTDET